MRFGAGWSALVVAALWLLVAFFALDVLFQMTVAQRAIVWLVVAAGTIWAFRRYTRPFLGVRETELDMALLVERQQQIDSDVVAALQFETPEARRWGSPQLETAVVDYVADWSRGVNVFEGFSRQQLARRAVTLAATLAVIMLAAVAFPEYARVFANRLLLGAWHYPTRTVIDHIVINHQHVLSREIQRAAPSDLKCAQSRPVKFFVQCSGELPDTGAAKLRSPQSGQMRQVDLQKLTLDDRLARLRAAEASLQRVVDDPDSPASGAWRDEVIALLKLDVPSAAARLEKSDGEPSQLTSALDELRQSISSWPGAAGATAVYVGELGRLTDTVSYKLYLGDAWTDPAKISMIPLPVVETRLVPTPPEYARGKTDPPDPSSRQIAVLEGSRVDVSVECTNKKRLSSAWLIAKNKAGAKKFPLEMKGTDGVHWTLADAGSPLLNVREELRYEIQVQDADGLQLETPVQGFIRIKTDRPPTGSAEVVHRVVLPTAKPVIEFKANDDFGIAKIQLQMQVERAAAAQKPMEPGTSLSANDAADSQNQNATPQERAVQPVLAANQRLLADKLPFTGKHEVDLSPLKLVKGDRLRLTLEIQDYRGDQPGETFLSDPLYLEISDESGVFAAILEADEKSEQRLTEIIKRQLGIGESP